MQYIARFQSHLVEQREAVNHVACFRPSDVGRGSKVKNWEQNTALPFSLIYFIFVLSISYFLSFVKQRKYQSSNSLWFLMLFFFINRLRKKLPSWWWKLFVCVNPVPWWKCGRLDPSLHASSIIGCSLYTTVWPLCTTIPTEIRWDRLYDYSFKIFLCFWLAKIPRIIHRNQLLSTKFGRILKYVKNDVNCAAKEGNHRWWRHRPPVAPLPTKYTSSCWEDQRPSTEGKIFSKYCNTSATLGFHQPPAPSHLYHSGGMNLRVRPKVKYYISCEVYALWLVT